MNKTELLNEAKKAKSLEELTQMAADLSLEELDTVTGGVGRPIPGTGEAGCPGSGTGESPKDISRTL